MATVSVFYASGNKRSKTLAEAAYAGISKCGDKPVLRDSRNYKGVKSDYAVFYGLACGLHKIFADYRAQSTAIYIDLGYWHRRLRTRYDGYHKLIVNSRHPTAYFQNRSHDDHRFRKLGLPIQPWRKNKDGNILIASMSQKAAVAEGLSPFAWEREALQTILQHTKKPIVYRPKPNCSRARPMTGSTFDKKMQLQEAIRRSYAVVTRQSNVAVDALLYGVPVFCEQGVASVMGCSDLTMIESPLYPINREQWAADIAWTQFTTEEIATGLPFDHLKEEGLIP